MKTRFYRFAVHGPGRFPIDMLRYDCAWPASGDSISNMEIALSPELIRERRLAGHPPVMVELVTHKLGGPTIDRWSSFGWACKILDAGYLS